MSLELIIGPPNSGRTGLVLDRFCARLDRGPLLVLPTSDDVARFERELCERAGGLLGGTVTSFPGLFEEVARTYGLGAGASLSRVQRVWLTRTAVAESDLRALSRSASRSGFAPALERVFGDLQGAGLDAEGFRERVAELEGAAGFESEIADLFGAYERLRDGLGRTDVHRLASAATAALRAEPSRWRDRPVLLYGFDDLAREQIELLAALQASCETVVALSFEDRPALAARAELLGVLRDELGAEVAEELEPQPDNTAAATLFHLERNVFDPEPETAAPDGSLSLLEAAGERGEAELIGRRVARLIAAGVDPDEIAIAVRSPDRQAPVMTRVLSGLGVPVAAEARVPLASTATGTTLIRLLRIVAEDGSAQDVVAFLRGPARARPDMVDWLERRVLRRRLVTASEALHSWGHDVWELDAIEEAGPRGAMSLAAAVARIAAAIAERPHARSGIQPASGPAIELRAAAEVRRALAEAAELGRHAPGAAELSELLEHIRVPLWRGPTEGRVRILSPYRLRATRLEHLFVAGLTDGSFPAAGGGGADPLLSDERRRDLALPARRDPAAEERYLFYSCISRPTRHLYLSYTGADESGAAVARSPFVDEVRALLEPPPTPDPVDDELEGELTERIGIGEIAPAPEHASSPRALARAIAALGPAAGERRLAALELPDAARAAAEEAVASARAGIAASADRGPLREQSVLQELAARDLYGASTLEEYD
ncbi:MAG TPA: hypothetical protein VKA36_09420, partial [Solirubrobacterales bacterium]|nr:hypothetical protein [Solirubrobacterales bacterium]